MFNEERIQLAYDDYVETIIDAVYTAFLPFFDRVEKIGIELNDRAWDDDSYYFTTTNNIYINDVKINVFDGTGVEEISKILNIPYLDTDKLVDEITVLRDSISNEYWQRIITNNLIINITKEGIE